MDSPNTIDQIKAEFISVECAPEKLEGYAKQLNQLLSYYDMFKSYPYPSKSEIRNKLNKITEHLSKALDVIVHIENETKRAFAERAAINKFISQSIKEDLGISESGHEILGIWVKRTADIVFYTDQAKKKVSVASGRPSKKHIDFLNEIFEIYSKITKDNSVRGHEFRTFFIAIHKGIRGKSKQDEQVESELKNLESFRKKSIKKS